MKAATRCLANTPVPKSLSDGVEYLIAKEDDIFAILAYVSGVPLNIAMQSIKTYTVITRPFDNKALIFEVIHHVSQRYLFGEDARLRMVKGVNILANGESHPRS